MEKVAFLFAGQGAQHVGMGKDLYETFPESRAIFEKADKVLGFSLTRLCFKGPQEELTRTQNSQPAILTVSIAALEAYKSAISYQLSAISYVAGLSLGEYSALVAAGALMFEDAVHLVRRRGEFMEEEARKKPGAMLSILGLNLDSVKDICSRTKAEIANINCPGQIVISGGIKDIEEAQKLAQERGAKKLVRLEVSGAFHSSYMEGASAKLAKELNDINISACRIPLVSNVNARPVTLPDEIKENLIKQISSSVLWEVSMVFILSNGVKNFIEFGPGKVLKDLMRRIDTGAQVVSIENKDDILKLGGL